MGGLGGSGLGPTHGTHLLVEDRDLVAIGDDDGKVITWKVSDGSFVTERQVSSPYGVCTVAFSPNRIWLAAGGNRYVWIWALDGKDFVPALEFRTRRESVHEIVFDPASKYAYFLLNCSPGDPVQAIVVYERGTGIIVGRWPGRGRLIAAVASNCWAISTGSSNLQFVEVLKHG